MVIALIGIVFWISACSDNNVLTLKSEYDDLNDKYIKNQTSLEVYTDKEYYSLPVDRIVLKIENKGTSELNFGEERFLEKLVDGIWYRVPYKDLGFNSINLTIDPGDSFAQEMPLEFLDYKLTEGIYRIPKAFDNGTEQFIIAAEFEIRND